MKTWTVYKHVAPNGKVYIGLTSNVYHRWAANGYYYCLKDTLFSRAINKYGWSNFEHAIVAEHLTKEDACLLEKRLIAQYKQQGISYNITDGGEGYAGKHTKEHVQNRVSSRVEHYGFDYIVVDKDFNYIVFSTTTGVANYLGVKPSVVNHVLGAPIGYTCKKHYLWRHRKDTLVDIKEIRDDIVEALQKRKEKQSAHTKSIVSKMIAASLEERQSLSEEEKRKRYTSFGMAGKHHTEEAKRKIAASKQNTNFLNYAFI